MFQTLGGMDLFVFSKSRRWNQDLFEDLIAPYFNYDYLVASWQNGASSNVMPSFCKPNHTHQIENVKRVCMSSKICWMHTRDHSKWAISNQNFIVCIGDINRQYSQEKRGGGTLCMRSKVLWTFLKQSITEIEECGTKIEIS
jgi:deoxyribonuclease-2